MKQKVKQLWQQNVRFVWESKVTFARYGEGYSEGNLRLF
jgi:hypothetical protein